MSTAKRKLERQIQDEYLRRVIPPKTPTKKFTKADLAKAKRAGKLGKKDR